MRALRPSQSDDVLLRLQAISLRKMHARTCVHTLCMLKKNARTQKISGRTHAQNFCTHARSPRTHAHPARRGYSLAAGLGNAPPLRQVVNTKRIGRRPVGRTILLRRPVRGRAIRSPLHSVPVGPLGPPHLLASLLATTRPEQRPSPHPHGPAAPSGQRPAHPWARRGPPPCRPTTTTRRWAGRVGRGSPSSRVRARPPPPAAGSARRPPPPPPRRSGRPPPPTTAAPPPPP